MARLPAGSLRACKEIVRAVDREALHAANTKECEVLAARWQSDECAAAIIEFFKRKQ